MFSLQEAQEKRKTFWTAFGRYMSRHTSARGAEVKWLNYKTGIRDVYFRLFADNQLARISIELQHADPGMREIFLAQFAELRFLLHRESGTEWVWEEQHYLDTGQCISRIYVEKKGLNIYQAQDWHEIFPFFEQYLIPLDEIWADALGLFEDLEA